MARTPSGPEYEYFEDEAVGILEDALHQEHEARDFHASSAQKRPWKPETKQILDWLSGEESKHAQIITEHLAAIRERLKVIRYRAGPKEP